MVARGKRRRSVASKGDNVEIYDPKNTNNDNNGSYLLPAIQPRLRSQRIRKLLKLLKGFKVRLE